jgi:hypothetical protein
MNDEGREEGGKVLWQRRSGGSTEDGRRVSRQLVCKGLRFGTGFENRNRTKPILLTT